MASQCGIDNETLDLIDMLISEGQNAVKSVRLGSESGTVKVIELVEDRFGSDDLVRVVFNVNKGTFYFKKSTDGGTTWTTTEGHASAGSFGGVKLSDNAADNGTAAQGLAPSQSALFEAIMPKDTNETYPSINKISHLRKQAGMRVGIVEVNDKLTVVSGATGTYEIIKGLPKYLCQITGGITIPAIAVGSNSNNITFYIDADSSDSTKSSIYCKVGTGTTASDETFEFHFVYIADGVR